MDRNGIEGHVGARQAWHGTTGHGLARRDKAGIRMNDTAILTGCFADFKLVKTRSVAQIVVEVSIEEADRALTLLGGLPRPGHEQHVAVARLNMRAEPKGKRGSLAQQAGILCGDARFAAFLMETHPHIVAADPALAVREICGVDSRAEFDKDETAGQRWRQLKGAFDAWLLT
jgi:hypothetical protein